MNGEQQDVLGMDEAMRLLRKTVANKGPDYVYEAPHINYDGSPLCVYASETGPACVVGHALYDHGVSLTDLQVASQCEWIAAELPDEFEGARLTAAAGAVFQEAQSVQDRLHSWGDALQAAEAKYRELGGTE